MSQVIGETNCSASLSLKVFHLDIAIWIITYLNLSLDSDLDS